MCSTFGEAFGNYYDKKGGAWWSAQLTCWSDNDECSIAWGMKNCEGWDEKRLGEA
jgi:hypothetical protein